MSRLERVGASLAVVVVGVGLVGVGPGQTSPAAADPPPVVTFATAVQHASATSMWSVATGDLDGDDDPDVVAGAARTSAQPSSMAVLLGDGEGGLGPAATVAPGGTGPIVVTLADLDGDTDLDVVAAHAGLGGGVSVLLGDGAGGLGAPTAYPTGALAQVEVVDLDGDTALDLVIGGGTAVSVLLGAGDGTFAPGPANAAAFPSVVAVAAGDLDGDLIPDLLITGNTHVAVQLGQGDGSFGPRTVVSTSGGFAVVLGDLDGDTDLDAATAFGAVHVYVGNGDGTFAAPVSHAADARRLAVGDVNGDAVPDLLATGTPRAVAVLLGSGGGAFLPHTDFDTPDIRWVASADLDGDDRLDLVAATASGVSTLANTPGLPQAPTVGAAQSGDPATLSWSPPAADGGSPVTGYVVYAYLGPLATTPSQTVTFGSPATTQPIAGLGVEGEYRFRVAAVNAHGAGQLSAFSTVVVDARRPGAPAIGPATAGNTLAIVSWTPPPPTGALPVQQYRITPLVGYFTLPSVTVAAPATSTVITGLTPGTTYRFKVAAINAVAVGPSSVASNAVVPLPLAPPSAPTIGLAQGAGSGAATVTWTAPSGPTSAGGSPITGYVVTPISGYFALPSTTFSSTSTTQTITGLTNGTSYRFKVAAINALGTGPTSTASNAVTPGAFTVPGAPVMLGAIGGLEGAIVQWTPPTSTGGTPITGYLVTPYAGYYPLPPIAYSAFAGGSGQVVVAGIPNGVYRFRVQAVNAVGPGPTSAISNAVEIG